MIKKSKMKDYMFVNYIFINVNNDVYLNNKYNK